MTVKRKEKWVTVHVTGNGQRFDSRPMPQSKAGTYVTTLEALGYKCEVKS